MNPKLSDAMLDFLRAVDAGMLNPKSSKGTRRALWRRGLIDDLMGELDGKVGWLGWKLTAEGKLALAKGRQMLSGRTP